jgi:hypothetical protein
MADDDRDHRDHSDSGYAYLFHDPVERFGQLPEKTRHWLENLREDDIKELKDAVSFYRTARAVGRFNKWLIITIVTIFIGAAAFGDALLKFWAWISHAGHK